MLAQALDERSRLRPHVRAGLQGLATKDRDKVRAVPPNFVTDSVALKRAQGSEPRWDYVLGTRSPKPLVGVEVHPATPGQVKKMIAKKQSADDELAKHLSPGRRIGRWVWIASGPTRLSKASPEYRRLLRAGIELVGGCLALSDG